MGFEHLLKHMYIGEYTEEPHWEPNEHTKAYFPLTSDLVDVITGNGPTATSGTITFTTKDGVPCASCGSGNIQVSYNNRNWSTGNNPLTWHMWCNKNSYSHEWQVMASTGYGSGTRAISYGFHYNKFWTGGWDNDADHCDALIGQWALYSWTYDGTTVKAYLNGQLVNTVSRTYNGDANNYASLFSQVIQTETAIDDSLDGYAREIIMEDIVWTDEEIENYYNYTRPMFNPQPSDFQFVEYIQSSGTQYIDTGVSANQYLSYQTELTALGTTTESPLFGARTGGESNRFGLIVYGGNFHMMIGNTAAESFNNTPVDTNKHTCSVFVNNGSYTATIDGNTSTGSTSTTAYVNQNFWIFNYNYGSVAPCPMRLYYFRLYTGSSTLVRDFVPCYRKRDGAIGLYDLVNNQFYTNAGTGTFTKGADIYRYVPGRNTLLYLPFNTNYNDSMGNTMTLINGTAPTYSTTATGEIYANVSACNIGTVLSSININTWTVSSWIYKTNTTIDVIYYFGGTTGSAGTTGYGTGLFINNNRLTLFVYNGDIDTGVDITLNAWHNVIMTANNGTTKIYVDGELKNTITYTYISDGNIFRLFSNPYSTTLNRFVGKYDEQIFENREWSSRECLLYFNGTKSLYGIS